ncbi:MAG: hypothetical protein HQL75_04340 [Magnetococcales bacterium]|nr:hypothetical protein [Magnetococcales bacterium]
MSTFSDIALTINLIATLAAGWALIWLYGSIWHRAKFDRDRFRFFALRDRLALLVMKGQIPEHSLEHRILCRLLNGAIQSTGTFEIMQFLRFIANWSSDQKAQRDVDKVLNHMRGYENVEYRKIVRETFELTSQMFKRDTWLLFRVIYPILKKLVRHLKSLLVLQRAWIRVTRVVEAENVVRSRLRAFAVAQ